MKENTQAIEALKRLSNRLKGLYEPGMDGHEMRKAVNQEIDKLIAVYGGQPKDERKLRRLAKKLGVDIQ